MTYTRSALVVTVVPGSRPLTKPTVQHIAALCFGVISLGGCAQVQLAPPQAPAREIPKGVEARSLPPEAGTTRVLLDANGTRAKVIDIVDETNARATVQTQAGTGIAWGYAATPRHRNRSASRRVSRT